MHILHDIHLERLEFFKTNLPHRQLPPFLAAHQRLRELCLGSCHSAPGEMCPLRFLHIHTYASVECPSDCVLGVAHPALYRLAVQEQNDGPSVVPVVLRALRSPMVQLSRLTLDFSPDDYDILATLVAVAPKLQKLKLLEKFGVHVRSTSYARARLSTCSSSVLA